MENINGMTAEMFKKEICTRCELMYDLRRRESILKIILDKYADERDKSEDIPLKYPLGAEGVKEIYKPGCTHVPRCDDVMDMIDRVGELEEMISKLMHYMMLNDEEKEVYYISSDITPFYPVLSNRIIRCNRAKEAIIKDRYDTKKLMEEFKKEK